MIDYERRFGGIARLYGDQALMRFAAARVCVIGVGGVGSWAVEALARSGIGALALIDLDHVAESNVNRQLHALEQTLGMAKVAVLAERVAAINPLAEVETEEAFVAEENLEALIQRRFDYVLDCIDGFRAKAALIAHCRHRAIPLVTIGGAGGRCDPTRIQVADLARTRQDPLLAKTRKALRREHGFPRDPGRRFGVTAVYSEEPARLPRDTTLACEIDPAEQGVHGLNCAGFGSATHLTASFGLVAVGVVLGRLAAAAGARGEVSG